VDGVVAPPTVGRGSGASESELGTPRAHRTAVMLCVKCGHSTADRWRAMIKLEIRDMTAGDIDAAVALYRSGGWDERRSFLETVLANPACHSLIGVSDGALVATGLATVNGPVGWVGSIFVDPARRSQGLGRAITEAVCTRLDAAGCTTQALIASQYGQPLYEKMGFRIDAWYQILETIPLDAAPTPPPGTSLRRMLRTDIDRVGRLDFRATGEDRRVLLAPLVAGGWLLEAGDELLGFLIQILPASAALVAPDPQHAACLLDLLRHLGTNRAKALRAAVVRGNEPTQRQLEKLGWSAAFATPRMLRGKPIPWEPALIWSLLGFAFG
jgi:GNAT superfamily N-acetyltransferase